MRSRRSRFIPQLDVLTSRITPSTYTSMDFGGPVPDADTGSAEYETPDDEGSTSGGGNWDDDGSGGDSGGGSDESDTIILTQVSQVSSCNPYD